MAFEHPALIGTYGMLPGDGVDISVMDKTLSKVHNTWKLNDTWGWDFPMLAMCAARLSHPDKAVDYLLNYPPSTSTNMVLLEEEGLLSLIFPVTVDYSRLLP